MMGDLVGGGEFGKWWRFGRWWGVWWVVRIWWGVGGGFFLSEGQFGRGFGRMKIGLVGEI